MIFHKKYSSTHRHLLLRQLRRLVVQQFGVGETFLQSLNLQTRLMRPVDGVVGIF
jgi:hypothetical protein